MRAVTRLCSTRFRSCVMPLLLGAFALRAFISGGTAMAATMSVDLPMCATQSGRVETLEIPAGVAEVHCEQCFAPPAGAPVASPTIGMTPARQNLPLPDAATQTEMSALVRSQTARAPPPR
jgi:hypothetical protein